MSGMSIVKASAAARSDCFFCLVAIAAGGDAGLAFEDVAEIGVGGVAAGLGNLLHEAPF